MMLAAGCGTGALDLPADPVTSQARPLVNGKQYSGHPSVGRLVIQLGGSGASCTATLVGKHTVLTAAHCVYPGANHRFKLGSGTYSTTQVVRHPQYTKTSQGASYDIALMRLQSDPPETPSEVSRKAPFKGQQLTLIGYGVTSTNAKDSGIKRIAANSVYQVTSTRFTFSGSGGDKGNTCSGDSGGPAFATVDGREVHLGVHSMASRPCGSRGINTRTDVFYSWLKTQAGGDLYEPPPDTSAPVVTITRPANGGEVRQDFTVQVMASDDRGVKSVELLLDGTRRGQEQGGQVAFSLSAISLGQHTLTAKGVDAAGNTGTATIKVTVIPPKEYGASCKAHLECKSALCASDPSRGVRFCSEPCQLNQGDCPQQAPCLPVSGAELHLCGLSEEAADPGDEGSCSVAQGVAPEGALLPLVLVLVMAWRRRARP